MDKNAKEEKISIGGSLLAVGFVAFVVFGAVVGVRGCQESNTDQEARKAEMEIERPMIGATAEVKQTMPAFVHQDDIGHMIKLTTRDSEGATAFLLRQKKAGKAFILERGACVKVIDMEGFLEPHYQVRDAHGRVGWVHCIAFEKD